MHRGREPDLLFTTHPRRRLTTRRRKPLGRRLDDVERRVVQTLTCRQRLSYDVEK